MVRMAHFLLILVLTLPFVAETASGAEIELYELKRGNLSAKFTNYGAIMVSLILPDKSGNLADIVLGYDIIDEYKNDSTYFGAIVGRFANRIGIAQFTLNGKHYKLVANEGNNTLHGGLRGFSNVIWAVKSHKPELYITFAYDSYDGEQGFPANLAVFVTFLIIDTDKLGIKMEATALDKATPVNLALHTYWNLAGHNSGDILSHEIQIFSSKITPVDSQLIPTGKFSDVKGSAYVFLQPRVVGSRINELTNGYDINYVIDGQGHRNLKKVAVLLENTTGREMELWSNQVGVQFYTGNFLDNVKGKGGFVYSNHAGLCLETQGFPDSVNHPNFPSQIVNPGETYKHVMVFRFTA